MAKHSKQIKKTGSELLSYSTGKMTILHWSIILIAVGFLFFAPFKTALFNGYSSQYDRPILFSLLFSSFILILLSIFNFFNYKFQSFSDIMGIFIWLLPLSYFISTFSAASPQLSKDMTLIHLMYSTFFIIGLQLSKNKEARTILQLCITLSGYFVVLYGLANMFGNAYFKDAVMLGPNEYRLTSVFQYANAYAAFLMAMFLCCLNYIATSRKWYFIFLHSLMLLPIMLSFWLTLSRGALVLFPIIFLFALPFIPFFKQLSFSINTLVALLASLVILKPIEHRSTEIIQTLLTSIREKGIVTKLSWTNSTSLIGWAIIIGSTLISTILIMFFSTYVFPKIKSKTQHFEKKKLSFFIVPCSLIIFGSIVILLLIGTNLKQIFPNSIQNRLDSINFQQNSVLERSTFYKDSIKVFLDHPILGSGGGGWAVLYERHQNNPYVSRQAHNFLLQYLVEIGIVGFCIVLFLFLSIFVLFIKKACSEDKDKLQAYMVYFLVSVSIIVHSIFDFEFSYVYIGSLLFLCLGGIASIFDTPLSKLKNQQPKPSLKYVYCASYTILALIFLGASAQNVRASNYYTNAVKFVNQGKSIDQVMNSINKAIELVPKSDYYALKFDILVQLTSQESNNNSQNKYLQELNSVIQIGRREEPNNRLLLEREYSLYVMQQDYSSALKVVNEALNKYPWELSFYERKGMLNNQIWNKAKTENNHEIMNKSLTEIKENYEAVRKLTDQLSQLPEGQAQGRAFYLSPSIRFSLSQALALSGQVNEAYTQLQPGVVEVMEKVRGAIPDTNIEQNVQILRWYLAIAQKLGTSEPLKAPFLSAYPEEGKQIDAIATTLGK